MSTRSRRDDGFTLVEVVVTMSLIALVAVAMGAAFTVIVRSTPTAENRVDDANALLGLTNWLPQDIASADEAGFETAPYTNVCPGVAGGDVLQLTWFEAGSNFAVDYRFVDQGPGVGLVTRFACVNGQPSTSLNLTPPLARLFGAVPIDVNLVSGGAGHVGAEFVVKVLDDDGITVREILSLDAFTTNVHTTLPPTTIPSGVTTTPIGPNQPPVAHDIWVNIDVDSGLNVALPAIDPEGGEPDYVSDTNTNPDVFTIDYGGGRTIFIGTNPGAIPGPSSFQYTVADPINPFLTATGTVTVFVGATPETTSTTVSGITTTTISCFADIVSVSPATVSVEPDGTLDTDVVVTLVSSGSCQPFVLAFDPDTTDSALTPEELAFNGFATVTIERDAFVWNQSGSPTWTFGLELRQGSTGPAEDLATLTVTP